MSGVDSLTASERRVAELAARDRSNKEIAQALFVTVKTVELHLSSVYRKLQIGSRRQLAAALAESPAEPVPAAGLQQRQGSRLGVAPTRTRPSRPHAGPATEEQEETR